METCGQQEKVVTRPKVLLNFFLKIQNLMESYAQLNRFWVGWTKFPLYELGQQKRGQACIRNKYVDRGDWLGTIKDRLGIPGDRPGIARERPGIPRDKTGITRESGIIGKRKPRNLDVDNFEEGTLLASPAQKTFNLSAHWFICRQGQAGPSVRMHSVKAIAMPYHTFTPQDHPRLFDIIT